VHGTYLHSQSTATKTSAMTLWATPYAGIAATRDADHCHHPVQPSTG
jgi:hypothetical protein